MDNMEIDILENMNTEDPSVSENENNAEEKESPEKLSCQCKYDATAITALGDKIDALQDLFVRRLSDDRQKTELIKTLEEGATFAFIEPFISDLILLLDRLEKSEDDFVLSVKDELLGILERRGVNKITPTEKFDPAINKAVKVVIDPNVDGMVISSVVRNGYSLAGKVIRPIEVVVSKPY